MTGGWRCGVSLTKPRRPRVGLPDPRQHRSHGLWSHFGKSMPTLSATNKVSDPAEPDLALHTTRESY